MNRFILFLPVCCFLLISSLPTRGNEADSIGSSHRYIPPVEYKMNLKSLIVPAALITTGVIFSQTDHKDIFAFNRSGRYPKSTPFDDCLAVITGPSVFLLDLVGEEKHHPLDQLFLLGGSYICAYIPVMALKHFIDTPRPMGDKNDSFPSAHTALAFAGAHVIYKEFKDSNRWLAYTGYALATGVGIARMVNNRHWLSDVLAGAGFGILGTELAYAIYFPLRNLVTNNLNKKRGIETIFSPVAMPGAYGMSLSFRF